jgi:uncharacterized protein YlxP (DUF503 family)
MFIGVGRFELFIPASRSLKDKRAVLRSVTQTVIRKFNVSIAEVDHQDLLQRAALGVGCVSGSIGQCRRIMQEVEKAIGRCALDGAEIVDRTIEVVAMEDLA